MSNTPPSASLPGSTTTNLAGSGTSVNPSASPDQQQQGRGSTGGGLYRLAGGFGSSRSFPRVPTNLSIESLDEMESKKRIEAVLLAAGVGEDFLTQYANQLLVAGVTSEHRMGQTTEQELISFGLMRAHSMKVVRHFKEIAKTSMRSVPSEGQLSSANGTPFIANPGSFPNFGDAAGGQHRSAILVKDFQCHCCMELILSPRTISCGHSFCFRCLESWCETHTNPSCPLCRSSMVARAGDRFIIPQVNQMLNGLVLKLFPNQALRVQQLQDEQANRTDILKQQHQFTRHPPNSTMVRILKNSAATGSVTDVLESVLLQLPRAEFLSVKKRWNNSCDTTPVRLDGLMFNVSAPQLHVIALHLLNVRPGDSFLDVGSGSGVVTAWASVLAGPTAKIIHGIDLRDDILHFSLRNFEKQCRFRQPLQVEVSAITGEPLLECTCASNALPQSPVSSPTRKQSAFVANEEENEVDGHFSTTEGASTGSSPPCSSHLTNKKKTLHLHGVHRLLRQGEVLSGVVHTTFKPSAVTPTTRTSEEDEEGDDLPSGDNNQQSDGAEEEYTSNDHSMPISFKIVRTFLQPARVETFSPSSSSGPSKATPSPCPSSTPSAEGRYRDPITGSFVVHEEDDEEDTVTTHRAETKEYLEGCVSDGPAPPEKLRVGVEVMVTAGRTVDDRLTRISRAFATVECGDEEVVFTEVQMLVEDTYRAKPYHFASTDAGSGTNQNPVSFVRYRLRPSTTPSTLVSDVSDGAPIQNITVTIESCGARVGGGRGSRKKDTRRTGSKQAAAEVQPVALCPMEANIDLEQVTRNSIIGDSLSNIRVFRSNGLDTSAAPMKVVKDHLGGGYDKIYVGASPGGLLPFKILCDWLKPGGVMVVPYEGHMSVVRKSADGSGGIEVEKHANVNFSVLEEAATQPTDSRLRQEFGFESKLPPPPVHHVGAPGDSTTCPSSAGLYEEEDEDMVALRKHEASVAALEYLDAKATRLPVESDSTVGGRHHAVTNGGSERSFVTTCCRAPIYGKVIRSLDAVLGEEYVFPEGKGCLIDRSIVHHPQNIKTGSLQYWDSARATTAATGHQYTAVLDTSKEYNEEDHMVFFDTIGCRVKIVACGCGKPIGAELVENPSEVGGTSPFRPGRTLLCMDYVEPPFDRPYDVEDIDPEEKICCKKCKSMVSETRHIISRSKQMKSSMFGRSEPACLVNSLRTDAVGLLPHSVLGVEESGSPRLHCFHVACSHCKTVLGYKASAPKDVFSSGTYSSDLWECGRYGLLINRITNVVPTNDARNMTLSRLLQRSLGADGGSVRLGSAPTTGGVGAQLYASLVESFASMQGTVTGTVVAAALGSENESLPIPTGPNVITLNLGMGGAPPQVSDLPEDDDDDDRARWAEEDHDDDDDDDDNGSGATA